MSWKLLFVLLSFSAIAQETELEAIEVEASKDVERFTFTPSTTVSETELQKEPIGILSNSIEKLPGVIANQNGGPGGRVSFFIRGTESRHVSFLLDGLKINDTSNVDRQFDGAFLTSPFVKEYTLHKGPQAVLFGSDAMGGVVEIKTRKGENAPETRLNLSAGSFGTFSDSLATDWKTQNHNGTLTLSRFHSDGISRLNEKRYNADERDATDITQITSSSAHRWAPKIQTDFLASFLHGKADQDGFAVDDRDDFSQNDQYILQQKTNYEIDGTQAISLRNGFNRHQRLNVSTARETFNGDLIQNELIHRKEFGNFGLLTGLSSEKESAKTVSLDRSFNLHSLFTQGAYNKDLFKFHAGARLDRHTKFDNFVTGSAGVGYGELALQYSQGYKAPSLYQLFGPDSFGSPVGNPELKPETNHSWDLSWKREKESYNAGVSLFQNRLSNQFTYVFGKGYINQQRFISEGVELSAKLKTSKFHVYSSFTHQQFREEDSTVLRRPHNAGVAGVSYFPEETVEINVTERWFSSRKDYGSIDITKLNGFEVTDLSVRKTWEKDDIAITVKNIFDREYEEIYGFNVMPRSIFANYGHRF